MNIYHIGTDTWTGTGTAMPTAAGIAGFTQVDAYLYMVGGWGDASPGININQTQRYDMASDTWEVGPDFTSARGDLALVASNGFLYAMGGDADGGGAFDATSVVERLDLSTWPEGDWETLDPLPTALTSAPGGFCTPLEEDAAVWFVGGMPSTFVASAANQFEAAPEGCPVRAVELFEDGFEPQTP